MNRFVATALFAVLGGMQAHAQEFVPPTIPYQSGQGNFEVWASQRSNALSTGFVETAMQGGFLGPGLLEPFLSQHPQRATMGVQAGWSMRVSSKPLGKSPWALTMSLGSEVLVSSAWRKEILELVFDGNANHTGRPDIFSGTGIRMGAFNRVSLGAENAKTRQRIELSLVQRAAGAEWWIPNGQFFVSEGADSMDVFMNSYATASLDRLPTEDDFAIEDVLFAYGLGVSGSFPLSSETLPIQFRLDFQDVGVMWEPAGGLIAAVDTGFSTTGLPILGDGWSWENVVDGNVDVDVDDLYFFSDSAAGQMVMLPSKVKASLQWWPSPDMQLTASARTGSWMPAPEFTGGVGWIPGNRLAFGVDLRTGGWGDTRPVTWLQWRISQRRMFTLEVDDPAGLFIGSETSANAYGRGVHVKLERLPGDGWNRFLGLGSRAIGKKARQQAAAKKQKEETREGVGRD